MVESHTEMVKVDDVNINVDINASKLVEEKKTVRKSHRSLSCVVSPTNLR